MPSDSDNDKLPERHDAIQVMADGMKAMAKHSDRIAAENVDLRLRVKELTDLVATQTLSPGPPSVTPTSEPLRLLAP